MGLKVNKFPMRDSTHDIRQRLLIAKLPAMPQILIKLIRLCQDEEAGLDFLASLIAKDAAITTKILSVASSSAYASRSHIRKPELMQSLQTLGMNTTKNLLISESVFQVFNGLSNASSTDLRGFWRHSLLAAVSAREIAVAVHYPHLEEAYLAGLLHDVGRLALHAVAPQEYSALVSHVDDASLCFLEERILHISHAEAGAMLIERWGLDSFLADSILYHHQPVARVVSTHPLIRIVMLADLIASQGVNQSTLVMAHELFGIETKTLETIFDRTKDQVKQAAEFLDIDISEEIETAMAAPYPSTQEGAAVNPSERLAVEVQQLILNFEARRLFSRQQGTSEVISAIAQSAALLFGFKDVILLMRDDVTRCLHGVPTTSSRQSHAEFMMPLDDGGAVSTSIEGRQPVFLDSGDNVFGLSEEQQLHLQICNGKVRPNVKTEFSGTVESDHVDPENKTLSLADEQLLRLLDTEHLVCLPLITGQDCMGVLIGAALSIQIAELQQRASFLMDFAVQAAAAIDVESRKKYEGRRIAERIAEEYRQASRRAVHEANNPLAIIKNYLAILGNKVAKQESVSTEVSILGGEIDRVGHILRELSDIKLPPSEDLIEINQVVGDVVSFFRKTKFAPPSVQIKTRLQAGTFKVKADSDSIKQILFNLIKNAAEAIRESGEIVLATTGAINRDGRLYCGLTVQDSGPGIAPEVLTKLFSPVQTTKDGDHMGLGLSIVHDLVRKLDGVVTCRSSDEGTSFEILLPICDAADSSVGGHSHLRIPV